MGDTFDGVNLQVAGKGKKDKSGSWFDPKFENIISKNLVSLAFLERFSFGRRAQTKRVTSRLSNETQCLKVREKSVLSSTFLRFARFVQRYFIPYTELVGD